MTDLFGLSSNLLGQVRPKFASQTNVPSCGSCRIYRVTSPRSINPVSDMSAWSHTGWLVADDPGGLQKGQDPREGRACRETTG